MVTVGAWKLLERFKTIVKRFSRTKRIKKCGENNSIGKEHGHCKHDIIIMNQLIRAVLLPF